jgi:cobalt-zinc-cadmium efflux system outer membrane protein
MTAAKLTTLAWVTLALVAGCQSPLALPRDALPLPSLGSPSNDKAALARTPGGTAKAAAEPSKDLPVASSERPPAPAAPIQRVAAATSTGDTKTPTELPSPTLVRAELSLPAAIETGLAQNPDLITLRESEGVSRGLLGVAKTYPFNPVLQPRFLPWGRNADGTETKTFYYFLLWQTFELAHQRRFREQNAAAALENTRWTIQQAQLQTVAQTEQLYFAALYQRGLRELAQRIAQVNGEVLAVVERRRQAGTASAADLAQAQLDARSSAQQARLADVLALNALLALRRQLNLPQEAPLELQGELTDYVWLPVNGTELCKLTGPCSVFNEGGDVDGVAAQLASGRPDVVAARANLEAAQANLRLARAARVPNVTIGPFYEHDTFATISYGLQAQMEIPVINTGRPLVHQREAEVRQRLTAAQQLEAKATVEARTALTRYEQARRMCEQLRGESSPQLPGELKKLEAEFKSGEIDVVRITQARTSVFQLRRSYLDSLNELAQAAAAVTAAAGLPPAALVAPPGAPAVLPPCMARQETGQRPEVTISFQAVE